MKRILLILAVIGLVASLGAQSVTELAKREKARRESFKGRHAAVIKNADLLRVRKVPGVEVSDPDAAVGEAALDETQGVEPTTVSSDTEPSVSPSGSGAPSGRRIVPRVAADGPSIMGDAATPDQAASGKTLEAQLNAANELVDLLTTKMNALRQQYEYQDAMVPGYVIQQQIDETNQRLVKAQAQEARIKAEMEKRGYGKKGPESVDR